MQLLTRGITESSERWSIPRASLSTLCAPFRTSLISYTVPQRAALRPRPLGPCSGARPPGPYALEGLPQVFLSASPVLSWLGLAVPFYQAGHGSCAAPVSPYRLPSFVHWWSTDRIALFHPLQPTNRLSNVVSQVLVLPHTVCNKTELLAALRHVCPFLISSHLLLLSLPHFCLFHSSPLKLHPISKASNAFLSPALSQTSYPLLLIYYAYL